MHCNRHLSNLDVMCYNAIFMCVVPYNVKYCNQGISTSVLEKSNDAHVCFFGHMQQHFRTQWSWPYLAIIGSRQFQLSGRDPWEKYHSAEPLSAEARNYVPAEGLLSAANSSIVEQQGSKSDTIESYFRCSHSLASRQVSVKHSECLRFGDVKTRPMWPFGPSRGFRALWRQISLHLVLEAHSTDRWKQGPASP